ncbi:hypothetical protein PQR34_00490 [Paraburkholderia sediminicola]|uniref:hypothetical protein n=1 Tax=Paraburkholderia sediminicola TaxID=458836 RepID=UPI0038BBA886
MATIDQALLDRTKFLGSQFDAMVLKLAGPPLDLRVFFTLAHGFITKKIAQHIDLFSNPSALMRLNDCFATTYLTAINGSPHNDWEKAFRICKSEQNAMRSGFVGFIFLAPGAFESCGACMANVHIKRDLRDALKKVSDVDPQDYGNILIFVTRGNLYAEVKIRGVGKGALMVMTSLAFVKALNLDVKAWRNQVFQDCYGMPVPDPAEAFVTEINRREGT